MKSPKLVTSDDTKASAQPKPEQQIQTTQQTSPPQMQAQPTEPAITQKTQPPEIQFPPTQPLSLKVAQDFYLSEDYNTAYAAYNQLSEFLPQKTENNLIRDFMQLKMALCMKNSGNIEKAETMLKTILRSRSPTIRITANY